MRLPRSYFIGIIDILMLYTQRKKLENVWKTLTEGVRTERETVTVTVTVRGCWRKLTEGSEDRHTQCAFSWRAVCTIGP